MFSFNNKQVFITGGSRGIGNKICELFKSYGANITAPSRDELNLLDRKSIENYLLNNSDYSPDVFIHCAGINMLSSIDTITDSIVDDVFQVNYFSAVKLLNSFTKKMKEKQYGRIVFISSLYAIISREKRIAYSSSKNALTGLMKTLALELADSGILVNSVAPGYVMTEMTRKNLSIKEIKEIENNIPTHRFQTEEDIANICLFLCSELNNSITGQLIAVDGGFSIK